MLEGLRMLVGATDDDDPSDRSPGADYWFHPIAGSMTAAGVRVSPESALRATAVLACTRLIAQTLGSLPAVLYRRLQRGKERAREHPLYKLFRQRPNPWQTAIEFYEMMTAHAALRGNAYAIKVYDSRGNLLALEPVPPDQIRVDELPTGRLRYLVTDKQGRDWQYNEEDIFHLRGMSLGGKMGISVIGYGANSIGMSIAADLYGARFFANDATPGGVLLHPTHFRDKESREQFSKDWQKAQAGSMRGRTAVLEDGLKYEDIGMTNTDAQFLEARRFQIADIARLFGVPLVLLGETEKSTSWGSGVEQIMIAFVMHTVRAWCVRWEQAIQRDFLEDEGEPEDEYFLEFMLNALLRGDQKSRFESYGKGINDGWLLRNEAREFENLNPIEGLDEPLQPMNMTGAGKVTDQPEDTSKTPPEDTDQGD